MFVSGAAIYAAAVLEYLVAEILEVSGDVSVAHKKKRIIPRHLVLGIRNDEELSEICKQTVFAEGGVMPHIEPVLLKSRAAHKKVALKK